MKLPITLTLVIALGFFTAAVTEAKVYTWKDASGGIHYSSFPPRPTEKISGLKDDLKITDNKADSFKANSSEKENVEKKEQKPKKTNTTEKKGKAKKNTKYGYCRNQQKNLELLRKNLKVKWIENGKTTPLNSEQRKNKIRQLENSIRVDCSFDMNEKDYGIKEHKSTRKDD